MAGSPGGSPSSGGVRSSTPLTPHPRRRRGQEVHCCKVYMFLIFISLLELAVENYEWGVL